MSFVGDVIGSITGTKQAAKATDKAADLTAQAQREALEESRRRYEEFKDVINPYLMGGQSAYEQSLAQLGLGPGQAMDLSKTPYYQDVMANQRAQQELAFEKGSEALMGNLATQGMLSSGTTADELMKLSREAYYMPSASEMMMPMLMGFGQGGQSAATSVGNIGQGQAGQAGNILMGGANTQAGLIQQGGMTQANMFGDLLGAGALLGGALL